MKKLALNKETLRKLEDGALKIVAGGKSNAPACYMSHYPDEPC